VTEFHEKSTEIAETSTQDLEPLFIRKVWKSHLKVAETCRVAGAPGETKPRHA
jgi:hypothetical protein